MSPNGIFGKGKLSPEHAHFVNLVRSYVTGRRLDDAPPEIDWGKFQKILNRHPRTLPVIGHLLYQSDAPWEIKIETATHAKELQAKTRHVLKQLPRLLDEFLEIGIRPIVLKGPALASTVYPSTDHRLINDLDLLVRVNEVQPAMKLLKKLGFVRPKLLRPKKFYQHHHFHHAHVDDTGLLIELHWDLTTPRDFVRFDLDRIARQAVSAELAGNSFLTISQDDLLQHMVSQMMPRFDSVGRLIDIALLVKAGALKKPDLLIHARERNLAYPMWIVFQLVREVSGLSVDSDILDHLKPSPTRRSCLTRLPIKERMIARPGEHTALSRLLMVLCSPNLSTSLRQIWRILSPDQFELYELGFVPEKVSRLQLWLIRMLSAISLLKMACYMTWRMIRRPFL